MGRHLYSNLFSSLFSVSVKQTKKTGVHLQPLLQEATSQKMLILKKWGIFSCAFCLLGQKSSDAVKG